jgi:hypothetical protein
MGNMTEPAYIRPFKPSDQEYAAVARVAASSPGDQPADFEYDDTDELREFDASFEGSGYLLRRYVAEGYCQLNPSSGSEGG